MSGGFGCWCCCPFPAMGFALRGHRGAAPPRVGLSAFCTFWCHETWLRVPLSLLGPCAHGQGGHPLGTRGDRNELMEVPVDAPRASPCLHRVLVLVGPTKTEELPFAVRVSANASQNPQTWVVPRCHLPGDRQRGTRCHPAARGGQGSPSPALGWARKMWGGFIPPPPVSMAITAQQG